jgi:plasmid stabilization system protein ParE
MSLTLISRASKPSRNEAALCSGAHAARDLVGIWRYLRNESSEETADRVESVIRDKFVYLAEFPGGDIREAILPAPRCGSSPSIPT